MWSHDDPIWDTNVFGSQRTVRRRVHHTSDVVEPVLPRAAALVSASTASADHSRIELSPVSLGATTGAASFSAPPQGASAGVQWSHGIADSAHQGRQLPARPQISWGAEAPQPQISNETHHRKSPQVIMAAAYHATTLGLAVFDMVANEVSILQTQDEVQGPLSFQMLQLAKMQVEPHLLLVSTKSDENMLRAAGAAFEGGRAGDDGDGEDDGDEAGGFGEGECGSAGRSFEVRLERSAAFVYDKALRRLDQLYVNIHTRPSSDSGPSISGGGDPGPGPATAQQPTHASSFWCPPGASSSVFGSAGPRARAGGASQQQLSPQCVLRVAGLVDLCQQQAVAALGALVGFVLREGLAPGGFEGSYVGPGGGPISTNLGCGSEVYPSTQGGGGGAASGLGLRHTLVVDRVSHLAISGLLQVDLPTLYGLQILASERHPSAMGLGKSKEGFSLFGLANRCVTQMGKKMLRMWFLRPLVNLEMIYDRQDTLELLLRNGGELIPALHAELRKVPDVPSLLRRVALAQQRPDPKAMQQLQNCLQQLLRLRAAFEMQLAPGLAAAGGGARVGRSHDPGMLLVTHDSYMRGAAVMGTSMGPSWDTARISHKVLSQIDPELQTPLDWLLSMLDSNQSKDDMLVARGVCHELDQLKATYLALPQRLSEVVASELRRVPRYLARENMERLWSVLYLPQIGFVMQVQGQQLTADVLEVLSDYEVAFEGLAGPEWPAGSAAEGGSSATHGSAGEGNANWATFYRTRETTELNACFGDLHYKIRDLEAVILAEMVGRLLRQFGPRLHSAASAVAELDCLLTLATLAADGGCRGAPYCRPQLTTETVIKIVNGRHPLAETVVDRYIPFTTCMSLDRGRLQVVTGPNSSGKSCYARAVALITYLAHLGAYVPAESAIIGLADRIAARSATVALPLGLLAGGGALAGGGWEGSVEGGGGGVGRPSSFMADLVQVSAMLRGATCRTLLILDEFGKGTLASDGVGLTAALLNHFAEGLPDCEGGAPADGAADAELSVSRSTDPWAPGVQAAAHHAAPLPPRMILCTHFHELFRPAVLNPSTHLAFLQMEVLSGETCGSPAQSWPGQQQGPGPRLCGPADGAASGMPEDLFEQQQEDAEELEEHVFLYRLVPGQCPASFGVYCARLAGLDEAVCRRAREIIGAQQFGGMVQRSPRVLCCPLVQHDIRRLRQLQASASLPEPESDSVLRSLLLREVEEAEAAAAAAGS